MNANRIFTVLVEREGYNKQQAALLSKDLAGIAEEIRPLFEAWINSGDKPDYEYKGITLFNLISSTGMSYPAAVSTFDWLLKDSDVALPVINKMMRTE